MKWQDWKQAGQQQRDENIQLTDYVKLNLYTWFNISTILSYYTNQNFDLANVFKRFWSVYM